MGAVLVRGGVQAARLTRGESLRGVRLPQWVAESLGSGVWVLGFVPHPQPTPGGSHPAERASHNSWLGGAWVSRVRFVIHPQLTDGGRSKTPSR